MFQRLFLLWLLLLLRPLLLVAESGWSGNGGDGHFTQNNIWNVGDQPIPYCLQVAPAFPFQQSELEEMITKSIQLWTDFFKKYQMNEKNLLFKISVGQFQNLGRISQQFIKKNDCSLSPIESGEIQFFFGLKNAVIKNYSQFSSAELKLGAAIRPDYDHLNYRHGGYIWIDAFSTEKNKMQHLILHELGHIFGMKHNSTYVMNEEVAEDLYDPHATEDDFGMIESAAWPFMLQQNAVVDLSSWRNKKRFQDFRNERCENRHFISNRFLPAPLLKRFQLLPQGCHRFQLKLVEKRLHKKIFHLSLFTPREEKLSWVGEFVSDHHEADELLFPSLFTQVKGKWGWATLGLLKQDLPAKGFFQVGQEKIAAQIHLNKGIELELFFAQELGRWFTTISY